MRDIALNANTSISAEKEELRLQWSDILWPLMYMLSLVMIGLHFPLGYLGVLAILVNRFRQDKYDFVIMFTLLIGGYNLLTQAELTSLLVHIVMLICIIGLCMLKKTPFCRKIVYGLLGYFLILLAFAFISDESLWVQSIEMMNYLSIAYFIVPIMVFSGEEFDIKLFTRHLMVYALIFCTFYCIDTFIINGFVLLPRDASMLTYNMNSTFDDPFAFPLSMTFPRHWPMGLYILMACIFPIMHFYKLSRWHWLLIILAFVSSRTFSFTMGLIIAAIIYQNNSRRALWSLLIGVIAITGLYFIDDALPKNYDVESGAQSTLRIQSSIQQFFDVTQATDDEDLAKFGTGRMAQALPKLEHLYSMGLEWTGFGFLSRANTKSQKYIIVNELYDNPEIEEEVATGVEIVPLQIFLTIGYLGLILHIAFFIYLCWCIRKLKYARYFYSILVAFAIAGFGGFSGWIRPNSLYLIAIVLSAVILAQKRELGFSLPPLQKEHSYD